jgi:hypothetical protein
MLCVVTWLVGCDERVGGYLPAASIARGGFVRDNAAAAAALGREIALWGFVDHGNLYGDTGARQVLGQWWSGTGPSAGTWRFNLKAEASDPVGRSFPVLVPDDAGRDALLRRFAADAGAGRPTKVCVRGRLLTYPAPTQVSPMIGLYLELTSSRDVRFATLNGQQRPGPRL